MNKSFVKNHVEWENICWCFLFQLISFTKMQICTVSAGCFVLYLLVARARVCKPAAHHKILGVATFRRRYLLGTLPV